MQSIDDERWLTYALESVLIADKDRFVKDQALRYVFCQLSRLDWAY